MTCCFAGNRRNEDYVAGKKMQDAFLGLLGEDLAVAACVTSLFSNNKRLLDEEVSLGTINLFVDLIRRKVSRPRLLRLITSVKLQSNFLLNLISSAKV